MHRETPAHSPFHRLALALLLSTAGWNLFALMTRPAGHWTSLQQQLGTVLGIGSLWTLVIWKVWTRPRAWGRWVGIVMILIVPLHVYMWYRGMDYFKRMGREMEFVPELLRFLPYETLYLITGIVCLVLSQRSARNEVVCGEVGSE